jgi:CheY-like chemotaxis protein
MSHELRTPLNSLLILAKLLADNPDGRLGSREVEFARTIHDSGSDLLTLINDILDLSKIESGTVQLELDDCPLAGVVEFVERSFRQVAADKDLRFEVNLDPRLPPALYTDPRRLQQVLKNLLSNAFKFTSQGQVTLAIEPATSGWTWDHPSLSKATAVVAFSVADTGIGIPADKQQIVFEAFQQADGTTARKYGGTGLGLSISREIAKILGGEISVESAPGRGSTFTLYVPLAHLPSPLHLAPPRPGHAGAAQAAVPAAVNRARPDAILGQVAASAATPLPPAWADDDRRSIAPGDHVLLVVEDDPQFARVLLDLARAREMKAVVAQRGKVALTLARDLRPEAITLDLGLVDADGWSVLDRLKHDPATRHIPVQIVTDRTDDARQLLRMGAFAVVQKQVSRDALEASLDVLVAFARRPTRRLLVAMPDSGERRTLVDLLSGKDLVATTVSTADEAMAALRSERFDCLVGDAALEDATAPQLLARVTSEFGWAPPAVISVTGELPEEEQRLLTEATRGAAVLVARSREQLLDHLMLFLHRPEEALPDAHRALLRRAHATDLLLRGRTVLVLDDDVRNIFAVTSVLERHGVRVLYAEDGRAGIDLLRAAPGVDAVLMDIMMPELDGYQTIAAIRRMPGMRTLPIIALTAKAMKGDRERCIEAGASDYIMKPVDTEQLLSLLRVWLYAADEQQDEPRA